MNVTEIQALVSACPDGGTVQLPPGRHVIDQNVGHVEWTRSITIDGQGCEIIVIPVPSTPTVANIPALNGDTPNGTQVTIKNLTLTYPNVVDEPQRSGIVKANDDYIGIHVGRTAGPDTRLTCLNVKTTGLIGSAVHRIGGGFTDIIGCQMNAWESPLKIFAGHPSDTTASCRLISNTFSGVGSKSTSIGIYIHPNITLQSVGNKFQDFNYHGISAHGGPGPQPGQTFTSVCDGFIRCPIIATPLMYARVHRAYREGAYTRASVIRGDLYMTDSSLGVEAITYFPGYDHNIVIEDCTWDPIAVIGGAEGSGNIEYRNVTWNLTVSGRLPSVGADFVGTVTYVNCQAYDAALGPFVMLNDGPGPLVYAGGLTIHSNRTIQDILYGTGSFQVSPVIVANP